MGIETIDLADGTNNLTLTDALVSSANGKSITINGGTGADTIDAGAVTTASDRVTIDAGGGADSILAGASADTFEYKAVADLTGSGYDTIAGANFAHDAFDVSAVAGSIAAVDTAVTTGTLASGAKFNSDLAAALGASQLGAHDAVLFTASAGDLKDDTFLVVDCNGIAGYQANADLVIGLANATGTLKAANFI